MVSWLCPAHFLSHRQIFYLNQPSLQLSPAAVALPLTMKISFKKKPRPSQNISKTWSTFKELYGQKSHHGLGRWWHTCQSILFKLSNLEWLSCAETDWVFAYRKKKWPDLWLVPRLLSHTQLQTQMVSLAWIPCGHRQQCGSKQSPLK